MVSVGTVLFVLENLISIRIVLFMLHYNFEDTQSNCIVDLSETAKNNNLSGNLR